MLCRAGTTLVCTYRKATKEKAQAQDNLRLCSTAKSEKEELLFRAAQRLSLAFVKWLTHCSSCLDCRTASTMDSLMLFASVDRSLSVQGEA